MRCRAPNVDGSTCKRSAYDRWPMCKQHIHLAYKEVLQAGGFHTMTLGVLETLPELLTDAKE